MMQIDLLAASAYLSVLVRGFVMNIYIIAGVIMIINANITHLPIAANSIDCIFTDPPYHKENLYCYEWLAIQAQRVLKDGGFLLAMCGGAYKNEIFNYFDSAGLDYYFDFQNGMTGGQVGIVWKHGPNGNMPISIRSKSILAYTKGKATSRTAMCQWYDGNGKSKHYHEWGQDVESARYYIDCVTQTGDLVIDPFVGGGTTGIACKVLGRRFVGFDIDMSCCEVSKERMKENRHYKAVGLFKGV